MPIHAKPLSEKSKQHVFNELKKLSASQPELFRQKLIHAACTGLAFPSGIKEKISSLQQAYQDHQDDPDVKSCLDRALQTYFVNQGTALFMDAVLGKQFIAEDWSDDLIRDLSGSEIAIPDDPHVEATIKDGKVYWCVHYGAYQIKYRREHCGEFSHEKILTEARSQHRTFSLTWEKFRTFKDAGKRTGTVEVTEERFLNAFDVQYHPWASDIWEQLHGVGILNDSDRLSQGWYPLSNVWVTLKNTLPTNYQLISNILQNITNNPTYQEDFLPGMPIYRPARFAKDWQGTGRVINNKSEFTATKPWDVAVYRELDAHRTQDDGYNADHIPSVAQIKAPHEVEIKQEIQRCDQDALAYWHAYPSYQRGSTPYEQELAAKKKTLKEELKFFNRGSEGEKGFWAIYVTKPQHNQNPTTGENKKKQLELSPYDSIKKYLDDLEIAFKKDNKTLLEFLQALGAFRYMVSRMCKEIDNVINRNKKEDGSEMSQKMPEEMLQSKPFIHHHANRFFDADKRKQLDDLFIEKMQGLHI